MGTKSGFMNDVRAASAVRKAGKRQRQRLERELASYHGPAERLDIETIVSRYPADQTTPSGSAKTTQVTSGP